MIFEIEKMSWQTYVDDHLMCDIEGQHLSAAAIIGHDGSVWAQSATFPQVLSLSLSKFFQIFFGFDFQNSVRSGCFSCSIFIFLNFFLNFFIDLCGELVFLNLFVFSENFIRKMFDIPWSVPFLEDLDVTVVPQLIWMELMWFDFESVEILGFGFGIFLWNLLDWRGNFEFYDFIFFFVLIWFPMMDWLTKLVWPLN